jgi:hypothetical protein
MVDETFEGGAAPEVNIFDAPVTVDSGDEPISAVSEERMNDFEAAMAAAKAKALEKAGYIKGKPFTIRGLDRLAVADKDPNWGYRWCDSDPGNLEKKESEGYLTVNKMTGIPGDTTHPDSNEMSGSRTHRELTLMARPKELVEAHLAQVAELTNRQTGRLKEDLQEGLTALSPDGRAEGSIVID